MVPGTQWIELRYRYLLHRRTSPHSTDNYSFHLLFHARTFFTIYLCYLVSFVRPLFFGRSNPSMSLAHVFVFFNGQSTRVPRLLRGLRLANNQNAFIERTGQSSQTCHRPR
ncbi:hypothetical protein PLICRDRAFT_192157 [Plicaturopsis crispa FD-325 SS-3]|nr:hypothetical protein PLICRDRAFT_192157 [Plicaturopsis crispa FD-325 SS-3]